MSLPVTLTPGEKFGRLTVLSRVDSKHSRLWLCECICGGRREASAGQLRGGVVKSCGCLGREMNERRLRWRAEQFVALGQHSRFAAPPLREPKP